MKEVLVKIIKNYKWRIILFAFLVGLNVYLLTLPSTITGQIIDLLYDIENNKQNILNNTYYLLGICIILLLIRVTWKYFETNIIRGIEKDLRIDLFKRFLKLKEKDIQNLKNGEIMAYFMKDVNEIKRGLYSLMSKGIRILFTFIIVLFQMANGVNINLTLAVSIPVFIGIYSVIKIKKYVEINFKKAQKYFTNLSEYMQESTDGIRTIKAYACEKEKYNEFVSKNKEVYKSNTTVEIFSNSIKLCLDLCFGACYAISLIYGSVLVVNGAISVGELVAFNGYIALLSDPVNWIPHIVSRYKKAQISFNRLKKIYDLEQEKLDEQNLITEEKMKGNIEINNLTFNYPDFVEPVLKNVSLNINAGETIGIIGTVGSGKTTLMDLLTKLYNVPDNKIFIDGKDINTIPTEVLRNNICYITQDSFLFSSSLKDNISLFDNNYDDEDIEDSTKNAVLYDDIERFSDGINTIIGENGEDLSGGQKQRVTISRAFLKNSSILIFDDTFSALDNRTSKKLVNNIKKLADGKTCIIISNKVSDVKYSDKIIVLQSGEIKEIGTHDELLKNDNIYAKFYNHQAKKAKPSLLV